MAILCYFRAASTDNLLSKFFMNNTEQSNKKVNFVGTTIIKCIASVH